MTQYEAPQRSTLVAPKALAAWQFFQQMLADVTKIVVEDAESERELLEGLRAHETTTVDEEVRRAVRLQIVGEILIGVHHGHVLLVRERRALSLEAAVRLITSAQAVAPS